MKDRLSGMLGYIKSNPKMIIVICFCVVLVIYFIAGFSDFRAEQQQGGTDEVEGTDAYSETDSYINYDSDTEEYADLYDREIIDRQGSLVQRYGELPEGYLWDLDGSLVSLGDANMSAEEVVYAYLNGIRTLDFSSAQKYSRGSFVVDRYATFFDSSDARNDTYADNFYRNMYTEVLTSIQVKGIESVAVFADNRQVFTVELEILDLSSKDFWLEDRDSVYNTLYIYSRDESDTTKSEQYVYDYVLDYYKSDDAVTRNVTVNITVEKYARLNTGWLVTNDKDVDNYCYYTDGNVVNRYILDMFQTEGRDYVRELREEDVQQ